MMVCNVLVIPFEVEIISISHSSSLTYYVTDELWNGRKHETMNSVFDLTGNKSVNKIICK